jgi:hypothetical protein
MLEGIPFVFDHADASFALSAKDALVELVGLHAIANVTPSHALVF